MKGAKGFKEGDKVFAKVKGYPPWPAFVVSKRGKKVTVNFYGTGETGHLKAEDICYYLKNKEAMSTGSKKKEFKDALEQIEKAIEAAGGTDGDNNEEPAATATKRKRSNSERSSDSATAKKSRAKNSDSDADSNMSESTNNDNPSENAKTTEDAGPPEDGNPQNNDEDLPFVPTFNLVTEHTIKNWVVYADMVKEKPEFYKERPADPRNYTQYQVFPVLLPTGKYAGIKLHKDWPLEFSNEYDAAMYDNDVAAKILLLKEQVASGELTAESDPDLFYDAFDMTEAEIKKDAEMKFMNNKFRRVERLRIEYSLVELDGKIKNCLGLNKADPKRAVTLLDNILELKIDEIMLKKHSHVVEMIRRLRKYIGNTEEWNFGPEELATFLQDAEKVRGKAEEVYKKFKTVIVLPEGVSNFWNGFNDIVRKFREDCRLLNNRDVFVLAAEPYTRQGIMEKLEQEEELKEADVGRTTEGESEKVAAET